MSGIDIISDVHGRIGMFRELQKRLGYDDHGWHPDGRRITLLGDTNNGTSAEEQRMTMDHLMDMDARGNLRGKHLGNHEFGAVAYSIEGPNGYIHPHTPTYTDYQTEFLAAFPFGSQGYNDVMAWYKTFSLYSREERHNIIHACWNENALDVCAPYTNEDHTLTEEAYVQYDPQVRGPIYDAMRLLLWGPTYYLPQDVSIMDGRGLPINFSRLGWWTDDTVPDEDVFFRGPEFIPGLSGEERRKIAKLREDFRYATQSIVFVGHYCMPFQPALYSPRVACLDFVNHMTAYRWNEGDTALDPAKLVCV